MSFLRGMMGSQDCKTDPDIGFLVGDSGGDDS